MRSLIMPLCNTLAAFSGKRNVTVRPSVCLTWRRGQRKFLSFCPRAEINWFTVEFHGRRILKIDLHLTKLRAVVNGTFLTHSGLFPDLFAQPYSFRLTQSRRYQRRGDMSVRSIRHLTVRLA